MIDKKRYILVLSVLIILNFLPISEAKNEDPASKFVASIVDSALTSLTDKQLSDKGKRDTLRKLIVETFDVEFLSRFTMGRYWKQANIEQRQQYKELFISLLSQNYASLFNSYSGEIVNIIDSHFDERNSQTIVRGQLIKLDGKVLSLHWRLKGQDNNYQMLDIIVEGISMLTTQREEMMSVIQNHEYDIDKLISFLKTKVIE